MQHLSEVAHIVQAALDQDDKHIRDYATVKRRCARPVQRSCGTSTTPHRHAQRMTLV